jgi:arylsulfatase A-like enzyme
MTSTRHLLDLLSHSQITSPEPSYVEVQPIAIARENRMCIFAHPPSKVRFDFPKLGASAKLKFGVALKSTCWSHVSAPVRFSISARVRRPIAFLERDTVLWTFSLDVRDISQRCWHDFEIDLSRFSNSDITLTFETAVPDGGSTAFCWAAWSDPVLQSEAAASPVKKSSFPAKHILFITADALRRDHLGCYGHPQVKTPNLDRLAREGCLFENARAQTSTTLGSYASILTSHHASTHGLCTEWGHVPDKFPTLITQLKSCNYHTVLAASETEVGADPEGPLSWFDETVPCLAVPAQDGAVTTRQFVNWLDDFNSRDSQQPFFAWLQFFDTHPPSTPPEPFRSMYYDGDPADPARAFMPEAVAQIHGTEAVLEIEIGVPALENGQIDAALVARLAATAGVLQGEINEEGGPDLSAHLLGLGKDSPTWRGLARDALGSWLEAQVGLLRQGQVSPDLLEWLRVILPELKRIESEILSWLEGVTDYRYALAQYMSGVTYLDFQIGQVIAGLEERGLYDQTTIFFCSPHGEVLGENGTFFHHHALMEEVLRIPAILKPAATKEYARGARITGFFDQIDITPTLLEAIGAPPLENADGRSCWNQILSGEAIPDHDSIAVDYQQKMVALARGEFVFYQALSAHCMFKEWQWQPGEHKLLKLNTPMEYAPNLEGENAELARDMQARVEEFVARTFSASVTVK